jgi:hypothetical protein
MQYFEDFDPKVEQEEITSSRETLEKVAKSAEDKRVVAAYRALEEGRKMVSLSEAIARGDLGEKRMPKLAVARADFTTVRVSSFADGSLRYFNKARRKKNTWRVEFPALMGRAADRETPPRVGTANLPYIPPTIRPQDPENYLCFWEAQWRVDDLPRPRPTLVLDPALLEHVVGDLYVVVATWDLSPIEAAALS